jgi:lipoic acid synthetase
MSNTPYVRKPAWLKVALNVGPEYKRVRSIISDLRLNTVCSEARCPNLHECWNAGTATFMILGEICTRRCGFCNVTSGRPAEGVDEQEPQRVAEAVARLGLKHAVITSVDRDDLADGGATHFKETVLAIKRQAKACAVEILTPDFKGKPDALETVLAAGPEIFSHNIETVPRLYRSARPGSKYANSLALLQAARKIGHPEMRVKSSLMLGLGEHDDEVRDVLLDLFRAGVQVVAMGQYLQPSKDHLPVDRYVSPDAFAVFRDYGLSIGLLHVEAGPLVRSSYHAERHRPDPPGLKVLQA